MLYSYSFVKRRSSDSIMIHPLVHVWARERLSLDTKRTISGEAFRIIIDAARIPDDDYSRPTERWAFERRLLPHIDIALKWVLSLHSLDQLSVENSALWNDSGLIYALHKRPVEAEKLYKWALERSGKESWRRSLGNYVD